MPLKTAPRKANVSEDHASEGQCLGRPCLVRPTSRKTNASEGHASQGTNKRRRQKKQSKRKEILLLMPRKTASTSPTTTEGATVPPSLFSIARPRIPSPPRKNAWPPRDLLCTVCPSVLYLFDTSVSCVAHLPSHVGGPPSATTNSSIPKAPFPRSQALTMTSR
jgi:hypothetical protein